jgi:ATP-dependent Lon protease
MNVSLIEPRIVCFDVFTFHQRAEFVLDSSKSGGDLGLPALIAMGSALIGKSVHGSMICVGGINLGGGIETIFNAASIVELAAEKGATTLLMPVSSRTS